MNIIADSGGLGDAIARLPAIKYVADHHKHIQQHLWIHTYMKDFAKNCLRNTNVIVRGMDDMERKFVPRLTRMFSKHLFNNMASPITDHAFQVLVNKTVELSDMNYLQPDLSKVSLIKFNLPKNYVVICPYWTAPAREFLGSTINEIAKYIKILGYEVVFLGKKETETGTHHVIVGNVNEEIDFSIGLNLSDKTNLFETTRILSEAKMVIGLDSGLLHLAGCTDTIIIGGFTSVEPKYRMPIRHDIRGWKYYPVVPPESLKCRFCQSNMTFTYEKDFKFCYYEDYLCVKQLNSILYIEQIEKSLNENP
jgi:ADP-heptose:LPS heptosyltransferase